jgi:DNA-directed RNA polymerase II subunit RPB1
MGIVQDSLLSVYLLTSKSQFLTRQQVMQLMMTIQYPNVHSLPKPAICKPQELWTGKQVFSLLLPPISLRKKLKSKNNSWFNDDKSVLIKNGELLCGRICKQTLGASSGGIIHVTCRLQSDRTALNFMSDCQRLSNLWLEWQGFSIGLSDCVVSHNTQEQIDSTVKACVEHINQVSDMAKQINIPFEKQEREVSKILGRMLDITGGIIQKQLGDDNALNAMVQAGSKGNPINISQIMGCVGQQSIEGHRILNETNPLNRTLPCFEHGCNSVESHGFVRSSYVKGLNSSEMFFHNQSGREGIVDTSVKTADTGYLQRRIMKALETITVEYDGTVRDSHKNLVELRYGGDNCDAAQLERVNLSFLKLNVEQLKKKFQPYAEAELETLLLLSRQTIQEKLSLISPILDTVSFLPVNIPLLLLQQSSPLEPGELLLTPEEAHEAVCELLLYFEKTHSDKQTLFLRTSIAFTLRSAEVVDREKLSINQFQDLLDTIKRLYEKSAVHPGEMVGVLAAESTGEPCTQLTLNTFHSCGIAEKNITLGVPRIKELIDARRNISASYSDIYLLEPICHNRDYVKTLRETLAATTLKDCILKSLLVHEPSLLQTTVDHPIDTFLVDVFAKYGNVQRYKDFSSYVLRIELDQSLLVRKELTIRHIKTLLEQYMVNTDLYILQCSEPNMEEWIIRIRMCGLQPMKQKMKEQITEHSAKVIEKMLVDFEKNMAHALLKDLSEKIFINGILSIQGAIMHRSTRTKINLKTLENHDVSEWALQTTGTNLRELWQLPMVDWQRSVSNDVFEVLDLLGIEAASTALFSEVRTVLSFDGGYVDDRHILMIVNIMTRHGDIMPLNRHGLNKLQTGPLVKCTFEEAVDIVFEAGAFAEENPVISVSDNIMFGQPIPGGTGKPQLLMDQTYLDSTFKKNKQVSDQPSLRSQRVIRTHYSEYANSKDENIKKRKRSPTPPRHNSSTFFPTSPTYYDPTPTSPMYIPTSPTYEPMNRSTSPATTLLSYDSPNMFLSSLSYSIPAEPSSQSTSFQSMYRPSTPKMPKNINGIYRPSSPVFGIPKNDNIVQTITETIDSLVRVLIHDNPSHESNVQLYAENGELNTPELLIHAKNVFSSVKKQ